MDSERRLKSNKFIGKIFIEKLKIFSTGLIIGCILTQFDGYCKLQSSLQYP